MTMGILITKMTNQMKISSIVITSAMITSTILTMNVAKIDSTIVMVLDLIMGIAIITIFKITLPRLIIIIMTIE